MKLREDFKAATGKEWKPDQQKPLVKESISTRPLPSDPKALNEQIVNQGNKIRQLKSEKAAKVISCQEFFELFYD